MSGSLADRVRWRGNMSRHTNAACIFRHAYNTACSPGLGFSRRHRRARRRWGWRTWGRAFGNHGFETRRSEMSGEPFYSEFLYALVRARSSQMGTRRSCSLSKQAPRPKELVRSKQQTRRSRRRARCISAISALTRREAKARCILKSEQKRV